MIVNKGQSDKELSGSSGRAVSKSPHLIRVAYSPKLSGRSSNTDWTSDRDRTSDYVTDEDLPTDPSRHISYGSVDHRYSNST